MNSVSPTIAANEPGSKPVVGSGKMDIKDRDVNTNNFACFKSRCSLSAFQCSKASSQIIIIR